MQHKESFLPLILYMTVLNESIGWVLGQHDETERKEHEQEIHYILSHRIWLIFKWIQSNIYLKSLLLREE